jgi:hypothetical protein
MYVHSDARRRMPVSSKVENRIRSMADARIENLILNSPSHAPERHFKFTDEGITGEIVEGRRSSSHFIPIARPKKKGKQLSLDNERTQDRTVESKTVNRIRQRVGMLRDGGHVGVTPTTAVPLLYWTDPELERKLFFCQVEAVKTLTCIAESAKKFDGVWIENGTRAANAPYDKAQASPEDRDRRSRLVGALQHHDPAASEAGKQEDRGEGDQQYGDEALKLIGV